MVFPDARVELRMGTTWTDVTSDAMHDSGGITYRWGRRSEGSRTEPSTAEFELLNPDGKYSSRNPLSPYYGQLGRNTPVRISHDGADVAFIVPPDELVRASTVDHASLDIVGDIDVRADLTPAQWASATTAGSWEVMAKWGGIPQCSWALLVSDSGRVRLTWSTNGVTSLLQQSTVEVPFAPGERGAIRATLDVDNGAGGHVVTFYTAPTMAGSWIQLGTAVVGVGTTSIFSSTASLHVGDVFAQDGANIARNYHAIEVRSGIAGSAVANPVFSSQASGAINFVDAAGRTWSCPSGSLTSRRTRAVLEASSWAPRWSSGGLDVMTPVEASGILRRLGQGSKPLASALRRRLPAGNPIAYWPLEDGREATQAGSPIAGCPPLRVSGFTFGQDSSCPGAASLPSIGQTATMQARVPNVVPGIGYTISMVYSLDSAPAGTSPWLAFTSTGTAAHNIVVNFTSPNVVIDFYDAADVLITSTSFSNTGLIGDGLWIRVDLTASYVGPTTDYTAVFVATDGSTQATSTTSLTGLPGIVEDIATAFGTDLSGMRLGHLAVFDEPSVSIWAGSESGYSGEVVGDRLIRLAEEEGVPLSVSSRDSDDTPLGPQRPDTLLDLFWEAETADMGFLYEERQRAALAYRTRTTLYNQAPALTLTYSQLVTPFETVDDDRYLRNDRTASRELGSSARAVLESGTLSIQDPPDGVGLYDDTTTVNVHADDQLNDIAGWLLHLGTVDEARYPQVRILLHKHPTLIPEVCRLKPGDIVRITGLPSFLPPGPIDLMVEGGVEEIRALEWTVTLVCSPGSPWNVIELDDDDARLDTDGSTLAVAVNSSATTLVVHTTQPATAGLMPVWTEDAGDYPFDLEIGGEHVTAVAGAPLAADTFTRSVTAGSWGIASDGHTYTFTGGVSNNERSVSSNRGLVTVSASQTLHRQQTVSETHIDADVRCQVAVSATATGGSLNACILLRWTSSTDHYRARVVFTTGGAVEVSVTVGGTIISTSASTGLTYAPGDVFEVRARIVGYRILMKVWRAGTQEPADWHIDRTDGSNTHASGAPGLSAHGSTGNSNVGVEYRFDNFLVETPQRITVTRSTNGIVKSQAAGEDIRLAVPPILPL
ncbi:hypothetical protein ACFWG6_30815 [Streptomyces erythrochromogenes]|uniref:hypothetical protein n=1 Tax=Streptomyces erythrochromogenes TaxID=285574 RepID=UPI0036374FBA